MAAMNKKIIYLIAAIMLVSVAAGAVYSIIKTHTITVDVQEPLTIIANENETINVSGYPGQEFEIKMLEIQNNAPVSYNILYDFGYSAPSSGLSVKLVVKEGGNVIKEVSQFWDSDGDKSPDVSFTLKGNTTVSVYIVVKISKSAAPGTYQLVWNSKEITRS